jgi:hypothetical protein
VPELLDRLTEQLLAEQQRLLAEAQRLVDHIAIIRSAVDAQQSIARTGTLIEEVQPEELIEGAAMVSRPRRAGMASGCTARPSRPAPWAARSRQRAKGRVAAHVSACRCRVTSRPRPMSDVLRMSGAATRPASLNDSAGSARV